MKINEIIIESAGSAKMRSDTKAGVPGIQGWPDLDNGNVPYLQYRFGMALAGAPDSDMKEFGPFAGQFHTIAYTDADQEILDAAAIVLGVTPVQKSSRKSEELKSTNTRSLTKAQGPIALKKKK